MANDEQNLENVDFDDILDKWQNSRKGGYRWEGDAGVRNFEELTKAIGYDQGIEHFLADNPGAIEGLLEFISEYAEKSGSEWKENLAEACDYQPEIEETDDDVIITEGDTIVIKPKNDEKSSLTQHTEDILKKFGL